MSDTGVRRPCLAVQGSQAVQRSRQCDVRICQGFKNDEADVFSYGWGRNAEKVEYPEGVAFSVGTGTNMRFLILQVTLPYLWIQIASLSPGALLG